ncbi:MAG: TRIC cation channel family protein [Roseomonas sp.]|jgi:uncharacterized membrane protein YeiH|nr:TRIC cation channel family protein [Roseomonas sp.]MCA3405537.1 TRIC cation channel family protein [Roseomonas sp.]
MRAGPEWFVVIEAIGIISFAVNAMIVAKEKDLSALGVFFCAVAAALGGGTLRDLLLGPAALPFFWVSFPFYLLTIFLISIGYAKLDLVRAIVGKRDIVLKEASEAIALASLGALGASKAFNLLGPGDGTLVSILHILILCASFGAISAAFGSVIRDTVINQFPAVLRPGVGTLEALFLGCGLLAALRLSGISSGWAMLPAFLVILSIRAAAVVAAERKKERLLEEKQA